MDLHLVNYFLKLFFDIRNPCLGNTVGLRNAKVLRAMADIPKDTEFYKQLTAFRSERADNSKLSESNNSKLYIAGSIVHLVDTKCDGHVYIPYWADRQEDFNQVIISNRMKSDHSMKELVDVLRDICLTGSSDGRSSSLAFFSSMNIAEVDGEEDTDIRLFMFCSNPDGKFPIILILFSFMALALSMTSMTLCRFFSRKGSSVNIDGQVILDLPFSIGFFSYTLLTCTDGNCDSTDSVTIPSDICVPYPDAGDNWHMQASQAFAFLVILFGSTSLLLLCISTCLPLRKWAWKLIGCMFLLTSLCQGLVFFMYQSNLCTASVDDSNDVILIEFESKCQIGQGAIEAMIACCLYFVIAIGSMYFDMTKRKQSANMELLNLPSESGTE